MDSVFRARKTIIHKDGYELTGHEVMEFIDGYQIGSTILNIGDATRLERHLRKIDRLVQTIHETLRLPPIPSGAPPFLAAMRERAQAAHASSQANAERLRELQTRYTALYAAINDADGDEE